MHRDARRGGGGERRTLNMEWGVDGLWGGLKIRSSRGGELGLWGGRGARGSKGDGDGDGQHTGGRPATGTVTPRLGEKG